MIDRNAWLDFASPEQLAEARRLSDAAHNGDENSRQKFIAEYEEFQRKTTSDVIRRRLQPERPRPPENRMQAADAALDRIEGDLPLGAWVPAGIVVQALRARHVDATAALWCLLDAVLAGRCQLAANRYQHPGDLTPDDLRLFGALEFTEQLEMAEQDPTAVPILDLPISSTTAPPPWAGLAIRLSGGTVDWWVAPEAIPRSAENNRHPDSPKSPKSQKATDKQPTAVVDDKEFAKRLQALDSTTQKIISIASNKKLCVNDKLWKISDLDPTKLMTSSEKLAGLCGVTGQSVRKTGWWKFDRIRKLKAIAAGQESVYGVSVHQANEYLSTSKSTRDDLD